MAWTPPRTWAVGELVDAVAMNEVRDNLLHLKIPLDDNGKVIALSSTYVADLSGVNLTGVLKTATANTFTAGAQRFDGGTSTRLVLPIGADKWAT